METNKIICGDALKILKTFPAESIDMVMTSPPYYGARDYGEETKTIWGGNKNCEHEWEIKIVKHDNLRPSKVSEKTIVGSNKELGFRTGEKVRNTSCKKCGAWYGQLGLEPTYHDYIENLLKVMEEIKRVLKKTGSFYFNIGDGYSSGRGFDAKNPKARIHRLVKNPKDLPDKTLMLIPERIAIRMIDEQGWRLRNAIIWYKPNHMPSSVKDRLTNTYEFLFHFVKTKKYYYDLDAIRVPMTNLPFRKDKGEWQILSSKYEGVKSASESGNKTRIAKGKHAPASRNLIKGKNPGDVFKISPEVRKKAWRGSAIRNIEPQAIHPDSPLKPRRWHHPQGKNPGDYWEIPTKPNFDKLEPHFALFPEKLCEKPILSSCPQWICKKCGKARVRISEIKRPKLNPSTSYQGNEEWIHHGEGKSTLRVAQYIERKTIGWTECECKAGFEAGIVLDPFVGLGTTCVVAKKLKRRWLGIDIKKEYCQIAREKLRAIPEPLL